MEIIMANGQMGVFSFERSVIPSSFLQGFSKISFSCNPISGITLNRKKLNKNRIFSAKAPLKEKGLIDDSRFLEKSYEFQPAFDEYLKAMESVKEKKSIKDVNSRKNSMGLEEDGERPESSLEVYSHRPIKGDSIERDGSSVKFSEKGSNRSKLDFRGGGEGGVSNYMSKLDLGEEVSRKGGVGGIRDSSRRAKVGLRDGSDRVMKGRSKLGWREGISEKRGEGNIWGSHKLESRESDMDLITGRGLGEDETNGGLNKTNGRWMNGNVTSKSDATRRITKNHSLHRSFVKSDTVKSLRSDEDLQGGGLDQNGNYRDRRAKQLISNAMRVRTQVSNVERKNDINSTSGRVSERRQSYRPREFELNQSLNNREGFSRSDSKMKLDEIESSEGTYVKEFFCRNEVGKKMDDSDINIKTEKESPYGKRSSVRPNVNTFGMVKLGSRITKTHVRLDRDHPEDTRHKVSLKSGSLTRSREEDIDENDVDMERAAFKSFEVFTDLRGQPRVLRMEMEERIQNLAKWLNGTDINLPEWLFSKMIHSAKIRFSDHSILRVIQILGELGNWRRVLQIIEWLQSRERFKSYKSRFIYTAALDALGKAKRPVEALNVFHAMRQGMSSYPDLAAYHCIAVTLGQAGHMKELFDVIDSMRSPPQNTFKTGMLEKWDPRLEPDIIVYNAVLNACARRKQWEGAFWVLQQLKQQGLQPSSTTYGLVMEVMFACEKYNLVYEFFRKVEKSSIPNSLNYKVLLNTLWKEGKTDEAVLAVQDMERRGIVGSASLYYDLARCLCSAGRCQEALMQIDKICKVAHKPLVVTYTGLIQACLNVGSIQNGAYIFQQMQEFCFPNLVTCNVMLKAYLEHGMFEDAKNLFQKMLDDSCHIRRRSDYKNGVIPDGYTFNTMLDGCATEQKWDDFRYFYQEMLHRGYNFNTKRHLRMILQACRAGKGELLETTWKHLVQANRIPPPPLIKERFCMKLEKDEYTAAISCITSHTTNDLLLQAFSEKGWLDLLNTNMNRFQKDTLIRLMHKLSTVVAGSDRLHPILQNLMTSCRELIRTYITVPEINPTEMEENICLN